MSPQMHIASVIVRARPERAPAIAARIAQLEGAEVHAMQDGKIIVVLEALTDGALADRIEELRGEPGVLFVNLVYHQMELS